MQTDCELVRLIRLGSRKAVADLYNRHKTTIYRYCERMLVDKDAAEDATQDTFVKMTQNLDSLRDADSFLPWLIHIARNEVLMYLRRNRRKSTYDIEEIWDDTTPFEKVVASETVEIVQLMLNKMKYEYREVLILREYEQLTYAQIAEITGNSESSVKSRLFKARQSMVRRLKTFYQ
jgi:RNA polymerase sigma-70 factor (ECF subfamily)